MATSETQTIRVHAWIADEETPYTGDGHDVTFWIESLDDDKLGRAAYTFEQGLERDYEPHLVTIPAHMLDDLEMDHRVVARVGNNVQIYMDLDEYEVAAFIRFNRPELRDRLHLCVCTTRVGGKPDGDPCLCDATLEAPGLTCYSCEQGDHNYQGRS